VVQSTHWKIKFKVVVGSPVGPQLKSLEEYLWFHRLGTNLMPIPLGGRSRIGIIETGKTAIESRGTGKFLRIGGPPKSQDRRERNRSQTRHANQEDLLGSVQ
jgi:hypothetical protein